MVSIPSSLAELLLDAETSEKLQRFSCRFYATYGMTETISHIALMTLNGKSCPTTIQLCPESTISQDGRGCLVIDSNHLPEKVITNDLVEIDDLIPIPVAWPMGQCD